MDDNESESNNYCEAFRLIAKQSITTMQITERLGEYGEIIKELREENIELRKRVEKLECKDEPSIKKTLDEQIIEYFENGDNEYCIVFTDDLKCIEDNLFIKLNRELVFDVEESNFIVHYSCEDHKRMELDSVDLDVLTKEYVSNEIYLKMIDGKIDLNTELNLSMTKESIEEHLLIDHNYDPIDNHNEEYYLKFDLHERCGGIGVPLIYDLYIVKRQ